MIVGLLSGSPGNALKANVLKSEDSMKFKVTGISFPVKVAGASGTTTEPAAAGAVADIQ